MKTKVLLAALSLPLVFTACSQDEWMDDVQPSGNIKAEGYKVTLNVTKGIEGENGADTRASWADKIVFEQNDKISVFWLGDSSTGNCKTAATIGSTTAVINPVTGKFNSIFRTEDGESFTSEAMVFKGGSIAVFPAQTSYVEEGNIVLSVAQNQDANTVKKVPYISDQLYITGKTENQSSQLPGYYGEGGSASLDAPVKLAANVVDLTMNLTNIPQGFDFEVQSVELVSEPATSGVANNIFTTESNVVIKDSVPAYEGKVYTHTSASVAQYKKTIVARTWSEPVAAKRVNTIKTTALEGAKTTGASAMVKARFVILPTDVDVTGIKDGASEIVIRTNCGKITIKEPTYSLTETGKYISNTNNAEKTYTLEEAIEDFVSVKGSKSEKFYDESIGYVKARSINVDASTAELNGCEVYSNDDIKRYVDLYAAMGKRGAMELVLSTNATNQPAMFPGLTRTNAALIDGNANFSLVAANVAGNMVDRVEIVGGGEVFTMKNIKNSTGLGITVQGNVDWVLGNGSWSMDDAFELVPTTVTGLSPLTNLVNSGNLTIRGTVKNGNQQKVKADVVNKGTLNLGGNNLVQFDGLRTFTNSIVNIEAGQELQFTSTVTGGNLKGIVNVKNGGFLTVANGMTVENNGVINNWGTIASAGSVGGLVNAVLVSGTDETTPKNTPGEINVKDDSAITYVQDNEDGYINLKNRNDEVRVESANKGNIVYNYNYASDGATFKQFASDKFTVVVFGSDASAVTLHKSVYNAGGTAIVDGTVLPSETTVRFAGTTKLTSNGIKLKRLEVASTGNLQFTTGNTLTVETLNNAGTITIGGTIFYTVGGGYTKTSTARVLSVGGGAIVLAGTAAGATLNATESGNYIVSPSGTTVTGVATGKTATLIADGAASASMTAGNYAALAGTLKVGENVTLQIGAGNSNTDVINATGAKLTTIANYSALSGSLTSAQLADVETSLASVCNPADSNSNVVVAGGTLIGVFKVKTNDERGAYVIGTWNAATGKWKIVRCDDNLEA